MVGLLLDDANLRMMTALVIIRRRRAASAAEAPADPLGGTVHLREHEKMGRQLADREAELRYLQQRIAHLEPPSHGVGESPLRCLPTTAPMIAWLEACTNDSNPPTLIQSGVSLLEHLLQAPHDRRWEQDDETSACPVLQRILPALHHCPDAEGTAHRLLSRLASLLLHPLSTADRTLPPGWLLAAQRLLELLGEEPRLAGAACTALAQHVHSLVRQLVVLLQEGSWASVEERVETLALNSVAAFGALQHLLERALTSHHAREGWFGEPGSEWRRLLDAAFDLSCSAGLVRNTPVVATQLWHTCLLVNGPAPVPSPAPPARDRLRACR